MKQLIIELIVFAVIVALCLLITRAIVNSDMPMWLKIVLLK